MSLDQNVQKDYVFLQGQQIFVKLLQIFYNLA